MSPGNPAENRVLDLTVPTLVHPEADELDPLDDLPAPKEVDRRKAVRGALVALLAVGVLFVVGYFQRPHGHASLAAAAMQGDGAAARVDLVQPRLGPKVHTLALSGTVQGLEETDLSPRANGYVRRWLVDIGDHVDEGQLLAEIDTPELDLELEEARAALAQTEAAIVQTRATRDRSAVSAKRYETLTQAGFSSKEESEQRQAQAIVDDASVRVSEATAKAREATLHRLGALKAFSRVVAPISGTITMRGIDRGSLVTAGSSQVLFKIAAIEKVRLFIQVPQAFVPSVRAGLVAKVSLHEYPDRALEGSVVRAAQMLDPTTRTMNTEVIVPNGEHLLLPGMYAEVRLSLDEPHRVFVLPATAVTTNASGVRVALVDAHSRVHFVPVAIERDNGTEIEIASGLDGTEKIVANPGGFLEEGKLVQETM
jgi:membrane fusion protein (multidrug efflux system)